MDDKIKRMKELIPILSEAAKAYYQESREIMSNFEYDRLYDELLKLEQETGTVFAGSPTQKVGYEVLSELPKERHERPMLSLNKTKSVDELREWLGGQTGLLSWKMDGLTVVLTYEDGVLAKAVTRGNGEIGEVITPNARTFINIPTTIPYKGQLILRGEAVISYSDFEKLNDSIADVDAKYKNPRNLCSGSVRQLNSGITASRNVQFMAFALVAWTLRIQEKSSSYGCPDLDLRPWNSWKSPRRLFPGRSMDSRKRSSTTISRPTASCCYMTISPTVSPWGALRNSREIPSPSSGPMRSRRRRSPISSGARREQDSSTRLPCLSPWSWKERR